MAPTTVPTAQFCVEAPLLPPHLLSMYKGTHVPGMYRRSSVALTAKVKDPRQGGETRFYAPPRGRMQAIAETLFAIMTAAGMRAPPPP